MALGIVKIYLGLPFLANRRCLLSVCLRSVDSRSVVVDPAKTYGQRQVGQWHYGPCTAPSRAGLLYSKIIAD